LIKNKLAVEFNFNVFHSITVCKNSNIFEILIDDHPAPGKSIFPNSFAGSGIPGLFSENCKVSFDGIIYTPGWDEFDKTITGWTNSGKDEKMTGAWSVSDNGLSQTNEKGSYSAFKGDFLDQYEFSSQLYLSKTENDKSDSGLAGTYPVYIDKDNYLRTLLDFQSSTLIISGKKNSRETVKQSIPLRRTICSYPDPKYGDGFSKVYSLKSNTEISAIEIAKSIYNRSDFLLNTFDSIKIFYKNSGTWYPLDFRIVSRDNNAINRIEFDRIVADALKIVSSAIDNTVHVYKLYLTEEKTTSYNIRSVKLNDRVILFLDGKQIAEVKEYWPASQVGLFCKDMPARYNGITLFEK
jgi:hypothetical protein